MAKASGSWKLLQLLWQQRRQFYHSEKSNYLNETRDTLNYFDVSKGNTAASFFARLHCRRKWHQCRKRRKCCKSHESSSRWRWCSRLFRNRHVMARHAPWQITSYFMDIVSTENMRIPEDIGGYELGQHLSSWTRHSWESTNLCFFVNYTCGSKMNTRHSWKIHLCM